MTSRSPVLVYCLVTPPPHGFLELLEYPHLPEITLPHCYSGPTSLMFQAEFVTRWFGQLAKFLEDTPGALSILAIGSPYLSVTIATQGSILAPIIERLCQETGVKLVHLSTSAKPGLETFRSVDFQRVSERNLFRFLQTRLIIN